MAKLPVGAVKGKAWDAGAVPLLNGRLWRPVKRGEFSDWETEQVWVE